MKTLEQLQAAAGELWPDIDAHLSQLRNSIELLVNAEGTQLAAQATDAATAAADAATAASDAAQVFAETHAAAIAALADQHTADLAQAASEKVAAVEAERRAVHARLDALVQAGQEAHAAGDLDAIGAVLDAAYGYTSAARFERLENELVAAQAAVTAAVDKLAALA